MRIHYKYDPDELTYPIKNRTKWYAFHGRSNIGLIYTDSMSELSHSFPIWKVELYRGFSKLKYPNHKQEDSDSPYIELDNEKYHDYNLVLINPVPLNMNQAREWLQENYDPKHAKRRNHKR